MLFFSAGILCQKKLGQEYMSPRCVPPPVIPNKRKQFPQLSWKAMEARIGRVGVFLAKDTRCSENRMRL